MKKLFTYPYDSEVRNFYTLSETGNALITFLKYFPQFGVIIYWSSGEQEKWRDLNFKHKIYFKAKVHKNICSYSHIIGTLNNITGNE